MYLFLLLLLLLLLLKVLLISPNPSRDLLRAYRSLQSVTAAQGVYVGCCIWLIAKTETHAMLQHDRLPPATVGGLAGLPAYVREGANKNALLGSM